MKFIVDAHLPPSLAAMLDAEGHEAVHTRDLPAKNETPDRVISEPSLQEERAVITKDTDFFYSHVLHGRPWKLLLVRTGNTRASELRDLFQRNLPEILAALELIASWKSIVNR